MIEYWWNLYSEERKNLCSSPNIIGADKIKKNEIGGECSTFGGEDSCTQGLSGGNLNDKRPLRILGNRKNDGVKFCLNKACITS